MTINHLRVLLALSIVILGGCAAPTATPTQIRTATSSATALPTIAPTLARTATSTPTSIPTLAPTLTRTLIPLPTPGKTATPTRASLPAPKPDLVLIPNQMKITGDVLTSANAPSSCPENWRFSNPTGGSVMLGSPGNACPRFGEKGGSLSGQIYLPTAGSPTVYTLRFQVPDGAKEAGFKSSIWYPNSMAQVTFDGQLILSRRTTRIVGSPMYRDMYGGHYAAQSEPILTTVVVTQSLTHALTISVPANSVWDLSAIEFYQSPMPTQVRGLGYSPYRDCQYPGSPLEPSAQEIADDFRQVPHTANAIRTYAATGPSALVPAVAVRAGMAVYAGAWIDRKPKDDAEVQGLIQIANSTSLQGVIVGNEFYLRHNSRDDLTYLAQRIAEVKRQIKNKTIALATAEIDSFMFDFPSNNAVAPTRIKPEYRPILDQLDVILVHIYPFWNGLSVENAAAFTIQRYLAIKELLAREYPNQNKRLMIGEAGWPSGVSPNGAALPTPANQERYMVEFLKQADQANVEYFYFDAFDELWKIEEPGQVGQHWGYAYSDRSAKYGFYGVLLRPDVLSLPRTEPASPIVMTTPTPAKGKRAPFVVFSEWPEAAAHLQIDSTGSYSTLPSDGSSIKPSAATRFFIPSGFMGDIERVKVYACDRARPNTGEMAMHLTYTRGSQGWGGVYWQYPENNWGNLDSAIDLTGATRISFWARGARPDKQPVEFFIGGIGYATDSRGSTLCSNPVAPFPDSVCPKISKQITLTPDWSYYSIPIPPSTNLKKVVGGFGWTASTDVDFYLDNIQFEFE